LPDKRNDITLIIFVNIKTMGKRKISQISAQDYIWGHRSRQYPAQWGIPTDFSPDSRFGVTVRALLIGLLVWWSGSVAPYSQGWP
jgi:hypothetical protein